MAEYIDKDTAITAVGEAIADGALWFDALERIPPADVRPVVRGEWSVAIGYDPKRSCLCSLCQRMNYEPSNYCPNCGADMRGDAE